MADAEVRQTVIGSGNIFTATGDVRINYQLPPAEAKERRVLLQLTESVKQFWIAGVLQRSIHEAAMLELRKAARPEAVQHPWERVLELPGQPAQSLMGERTIGTIFAETGRALLILGEPGAGKTITLLDLARELIDRFERDPAQSAPVVLNLSTWDGRRTLRAWLELELKSKYFVPPRRTREWLATSRLTLLLDGLDEVSPDNQGACVQAINRYLETAGAPGIAVCSRLADYLGLKERLRFTGAVCLQPLTGEQIDEFLRRGGDQLSALRAVMRNDSLLQELARSPLLLNVLSLAYRDLPAAAVADQRGADVESRRRHLFAHYTNRMFRRVANAPAEFPEPRTRHWLGWLAGRMQEHSITLFSLDQLQPGWLPSHRDRWRYAFVSRIINAFVWASCIWICSIVISSDWRELWLRGVPFVILAAVIAGSIQGLADGRRLTRPVRTRSGLASFFHIVGLMAVHAFAVGTVFGIVSALCFDAVDPALLKKLGAPEGLFGWRADATHGFRSGLFFGLVFGFRSIRLGPTQDTRLIETLRLSRPSAWKGAKRAGWAGVVIGAIMVITLFVTQWNNYRNTHPVINLVAGLGATGVVALFFALMGAAFGMFSTSDLPGKVPAGDWVRRSVQNAILAGLAVTSAFALVFVPWTLPSGDSASIALTLLNCCGAGVAAAMWYGGFDALQHATLRMMLRRRGLIPKGFVRFLDYSTRLIFLQKVGSGYLFVHRQLLEFFSDGSRSETAPPTVK